MSVSAYKMKELYEGLKNNFLFNNDVNSICILLSLYDLEENISNIYPKYICTKNIMRKIKYSLPDRENRKDIAESISYLIHDDINRIELCFYLEGYKLGFYNTKWVNILEQKAIEIFSVQNIYEKEFLFHFDYSIKNVNNIRIKMRREIDRKEKSSGNIEKLIKVFCDKVIKNKIINLDNYVDKQLKMDFNPYKYTIKEEDYYLQQEEIQNIYNIIISILKKNLMKIYKDASWYALNDKVIKRYR